jgi:hypothetical protein
MKPRATRVTVVFVGAFSPSSSILESLINEKAISKSDGEAAKYNALVNGQIVEIAFPWCVFGLVGNRFSVDTSQVPYVRAADLASKFISEIAPNSKVEKFGINVILTYGYTDSKERDQLGRRLVPPTNWGGWGTEIQNSQAFPVTDPRHGGLINVGMRQGKPGDRDAGWIDVQIAPGMSSTNSHDVTIAINDHYEVSPNSADISNSKLSDAAITASLLERFESNFDASIERSLSIANGIIEGPANA